MLNAVGGEGGAGGGPGGGMGIIVDYIMQDLLSKEVLYGPLKARAGVCCRARGTGRSGRWKRFDKV